jgi:hypothetical protein
MMIHQLYMCSLEISSIKCFICFGIMGRCGVGEFG